MIITETPANITVLIIINSSCVYLDKIVRFTNIRPAVLLLFLVFLITDFIYAMKLLILLH